jgi:hypothetical protein
MCVSTNKYVIRNIHVENVPIPTTALCLQRVLLYKNCTNKPLKHEIRTRIHYEFDNNTMELGNLPRVYHALFSIMDKDNDYDTKNLR